MDSTGLKVLLSIQRRADLAGGSFALAGVGRTVAKVLALTGLDQTFAIYDTAGRRAAAAGRRRVRDAAGQRRRSAHALIRSIRACSCSAVACAASGPPQA